MGGAKGTFVLATLVCTLAAVATGCGGGSSHPPKPSHAQPARPSGRNAVSRYEVRMQALGDTLATELARAARDIAVPGAKPIVLEHVLLTVQSQLRAAAAGLEKIQPPAKIKARHSRLIKAVREFADELTGVVARVKSGNGAPLTAVIPGLKGLKDMQRASDAITKAGYVIVVPAK